MSDSNGSGRDKQQKPDYLRQFAAYVPMQDPGLRYQYAPPYSPQRTDPDYEQNWQRPPQYDPAPAPAAQQFAQEGFPNWAPLTDKMDPGGGASIPPTRDYDMPYYYLTVPSGPPTPPQLSVQEQARADWDKTYGPLREQFLKSQAGTPEFHQFAEQYRKALETQPPSVLDAQLRRRVEGKDRVAGDVDAMQMGMNYGPGPVRGQLHLLPQYQQLGNVRPFGPGEFINRVFPDGTTGWSSEETMVFPYQGKFAVLPTLWMVNGTPMTLDGQSVVQFAQQSGLNWPMFNTEAQAQQWAKQREQRWQQVPDGRSDMQPPLWSRQFPSRQ